MLAVFIQQNLKITCYRYTNFLVLMEFYYLKKIKNLKEKDEVNFEVPDKLQILLPK